ncbi:MAG: hypothetical protein WCJ01_11735 [Ignavibacteria bacterium]
MEQTYNIFKGDTFTVNSLGNNQDVVTFDQGLISRQAGELYI